MPSPEHRPRRFALPHAPALDGLRGLAIAAVVLYHAGLSWAIGGFLGVEVFFVLSGFLITSLLLGEWRNTGRMAIGAFWGRRAKRLLPALLVMVSAVGIYYAIAGPQHAIPDLQGDGLSTLLYAGNWHQISIGSSYFAATGPVSPLQHTWSLAIEEQFYVFWPLIVVALLSIARRRTRTDAARKRSLRLLLAFTLVVAFASMVDMALLYHGGKGIDRVYYGTDTRAFSLLLGAALACWRTLRAWRPAQAGAARQPRVRLAVSARGRRILNGMAVVLVAGLMLLISQVGGTAGWLYPYGLVLVDVAAIALILVAVGKSASPVQRVLASPPLTRLGEVSYGLYLWHFPLFQWLDQSSTGLKGAPLFVLRIAVALIVTVLSYVLVEQPVRRGWLPRWTIRSLAPVAAASAFACVFVGSGLSAVSFSDAAARSLPLPAGQLRGSQGPCTETLTDTPTLGEVPLPTATAARTEYDALGGHALRWQGSGSVTFHTCPPAHVLMVGDSLGYTVGVGLMENEQRYGVIVDDGALLGCAFDTRGELQISGVWERQDTGCPDADATWSQEADAVNARAVVVELGYRDQFDWRSANGSGPIQHLGQPSFDRYIEGQITHAIDVLGDHGARQVLFLSVPWSTPPANPDGSIAAAASPARHREINQLLLQAAQGHDNVDVMDIDKIVSPGGSYEADVNGKLCRVDGIHFTLYCSELMQPTVLGEVRSMLAQ